MKIQTIPSESKVECLLSTHCGRKGPVRSYHMQETIAHQAMRDELLLRLSAAGSDDTELNDLCDFLHDDFPYDAEHVVGLVLRNDEFGPWQLLMAAIEPIAKPVREEHLGPVRERAAALLAAMRT